MNTKIVRLLALLVGCLLVGAACAGDDFVIEPPRCQNHADCPGTYCDRQSGQCLPNPTNNEPSNNLPSNNGPGNNRPSNNGPGNNRPSNNGPGNNRPSNNGPGNNTAPDVGHEDDVFADTGPGDTGFDDIGIDASPDTSPDVPTPSQFSGCTADADCAEYQACNLTLGRCEDARQSCSSDAECTDGARCLTGVCAADCTDSGVCEGGLTCTTAGAGSYCLAFCDDFRSGGASCAPDTQCWPIGGTEFGMCYTVGARQPGEECRGDDSVEDCAAGSFCVSQRGKSSCRTWCASEGSPACGDDAFCAVLFEGPEDQNAAAGACIPNCGGLGSTDDSQCGPGEACHPLSSTNGLCLERGTAEAGQTCRFDGTLNCIAGYQCQATGPGALDGSATEGRCTAYCNPNGAPTGCGVGQTCVQASDDADFGFCRHICDPVQPAANNGCPAGLERCLNTLSNTIPRAAGICMGAGTTAHGQQCLLAMPLGCNPDDICVDRFDTFGGYAETGNELGTCTRYCTAFDHNNTLASRCASGEVCAVFDFHYALGFCTSERTTSGRTENASCGASSANNGKWCADNLLCGPWANNTLTCRIPCVTTVPGTCPAGRTCEPYNNSTLGTCR